MPSSARPTASSAVLISSAPTLGPTNSVRRYSYLSPSADLTASTARCWAFSGFSFGLASWRWIRTSTVSAAPNSCSATSPSPRPERVLRMPARSAAGVGALTSSTIPPAKSMPKLNPLKTIEPTETMVMSSEKAKQIRWIRMKLMRVSGGTRCSGRNQFIIISDHQRLRPVPAEPQHGDHPGHHDRSEQRDGDADGERQAEALDRAGAEHEQQQRRDHRRDVRVDDRAHC